MNYKIGEKKFMQIETNINGQDVTIIKVDRTPEEFKKKIHIERLYKYDAKVKPITSNVVSIHEFRDDKFKKQKEKTFRK